MPHGRWVIHLFIMLALALVPATSILASEPAQAGYADDHPVEIIVTARRQSELLREVALPVSVLGDRSIFDSGIITHDRLAEHFPSLTIQPNSTGNLIFIRGVGNFTLTSNSDPATAWNYDGVFVARPNGTNGQFFDLERIELLKGPQGVLYGRNASAGSINIIPRRPVAGENSGFVRLGIGTYDTRLAEGALNLAIRTDSALRLSGWIHDQDNFLSGYPDGPTQRSVRAQLATIFSPAISVRLSADYTRLGGIGLGTSYLGNYVFDTVVGQYHFMPAKLALSQGIYDRESQAFRETIFIGLAGRRLDAIASVPVQAHDFYGAHAEFSADLGETTLTMLPAWRRSNLDAVVSGAPFGFRQLEVNEQLSLEARLSGRSGAVEWLLGTLLFDEDIALASTQNFSAAHNFSDHEYRTRSRAMFGNATLHMGTAFRLGAGMRFTQDRKRFDGETVTLTIICLRRVGNLASCPDAPLFALADELADISLPFPSAGGGPVVLTANGVPTGAIMTRFDRLDRSRLTDKAVTWRASVEADLGQDLVYASIETGFRPGGFNSATGFETFEPEQITAYTLGVRKRWLAGRLSLDMEFFWWDYQDQQASSVQPDLSMPPRLANITRNIGSSRMRGSEAEIRWRPSSRTSLFADLQYLDAGYRRFAYVQANTGVPPLTGCAHNLDVPTNLYTVDCTAQRPYNTPRLSLAFGGRQSIVIGNLVLTVNARTSYRSAQTLGFTFLPEQQIGGYWTSDAQLILADRSERFELSVHVNNVEGERVPNFVIFHPMSNAVVASSTSPRVIGVRALARF